jgi:hypothetical protein
LETGAVAASQCPGHGFGGGLERPEDRVLFRKIVHPSGKASNCSPPGKSVEGNIDRLPAAQIQEICRYKDGAIATFANGGKYLRINALWLFLCRR